MKRLSPGWHDVDGVLYCDDHGVYQCRVCENAELLAQRDRLVAALRLVRERIDPKPKPRNRKAKVESMVLEPWAQECVDTINALLAEIEASR